MKRRLAAVFVVVLAGAGLALWLLGAEHGGPVPVGEPTAAPAGDGWVNLLDGEHAKLWKNLGDSKDIFEIKDGMFHMYGVTLTPLRYATYTGEKYTDFELHVEFKVTEDANSGLFLRAQPNDPVHRGFEVQVLDDYGDPPTRNSCGSVYDVVTPMFNMSRPTGEWNSYDITVKGTQVVIVMNGWKVIDTDFAPMKTLLGKFKVPYADMERTGNIALQDHGGECWYRNLMVRKL